MDFFIFFIKNACFTFENVRFSSILSTLPPSYNVFWGTMLTASIIILVYLTYFKYRHIKVVKATAKKFVRQAHNETANINYCIEFIVKKSSEAMKIDELWIDRKLYKFKITRETSHEHVGVFDEKESLKIDAFEIMDDHISSTWSPPRKFNGAVMIGYWINNKKKYLSINKIEFLAA